MEEKKNSFDDILKLVKCSMEKCKIETQDYNKFKLDSYKKAAELFDKFSKYEITEKKYNIEIKKIIHENNIRKEALDYISCKINKCRDYVKNNLIDMINNRLIYIKNKKNRVILNHYLKLFKKDDELTIENYKNFYNDIISIYE